MPVGVESGCAMAVAVFINVWGGAEAGGRARAWCANEFVAALRDAPGLRTVDGFVPDAVEDRYNGPEEAPAFMLQAEFDDVPALEAAMAAPAALDAIAALRRVDGGRPTCEAFRVTEHAVAGADTPAPRTAPFSYVVRYYRPAADEGAFVAFYLAHHPPILAELPGIRNVYCYVPVEWRNPAAIPDSDCMLGNEVVFDSAAALDAALASDVRHRLREDYLRFPPFMGPSTHYAMRRERFWPGDASAGVSSP